MILTSGGIKGGTGKTTVAVNLAVMRAQDDRDVLLIDADDQRTASEFVAVRGDEMDDPGFTSIQLDGRDVGRQAVRLADKYDDVIIDTGGRDTTSQRSALTVSDLLLAPFTPRSPDIWTLEDVEDIVETIRTVNPDLNAYAFLNQADHQGRYNQEAEEILGESEVLKHLSTYLGRRKSFGIAFDRGQGVIEYRPKDNKAIREIRALYDAVFALKPTAK